MKPFTVHQGRVVPLARNNVDTDLIIPKQFLKSVERTGFGENLFDQLRYLDEGQPGMDNESRPLKPDFVLNQSQYQQGTILLTMENFGCGSSREHAVWALQDYGFRVVIAPSFAEIFFSNCFNNGLLPLKLNADEIDLLFDLATDDKSLDLTVDLEQQCVVVPGGEVFEFYVEEESRNRLLHGLDEIGITLKKKELIEAFAKQRREKMPWLST